MLPGVRFTAEAYVTFCKTRPWIEAVASSLTELFAPGSHAQPHRALSRALPWVRPEGLTYFKSRLTQAPRDSQQGLHLVLTHCTTVETQRRAFEALAFKLEMLWVMIDTIHHAYAESVGWRLITRRSRPLWRLARLDFDPVRQRPVLLYPEGAVLLNDTGAAILELCDGARTRGGRSSTNP